MTIALSQAFPNLQLGYLLIALKTFLASNVHMLTFLLSSMRRGSVGDVVNRSRQLASKVQTLNVSFHVKETYQRNPQVVNMNDHLRQTLFEDGFLFLKRSIHKFFLHQKNLLCSAIEVSHLPYPLSKLEVSPIQIYSPSCDEFRDKKRNQRQQVLLYNFQKRCLPTFSIQSLCIFTQYLKFMVGVQNG